MSDTEDRFAGPEHQSFSQCVYCKHGKKGAVCAAFPDGIPRAILDNESDHRKTIEGDHGILWDPGWPGAKHPMDEEI